MKRNVFLLAAIGCSVMSWAADFEVGGLCYNKKSSGSWVEVTYQSTDDNNYADLTSVEIPKRVTYKGISYGVSGIGEGAFHNCANLEKVRLSSFIGYISSSAFANCSKLSTIISCSATPASISNETVFAGVKNCVVYVPCSNNNSVLEKYKDMWGDSFIYTSTYLYNFETKVNNEAMGSVQILQMPDCDNSVAKVKAVAKDGYKFITWSKGSSADKEETTTYNVNGDMTVTAIFAPADADVNFISNTDLVFWYYDELTKTLTVGGCNYGDFYISSWPSSLPKAEVEHVVVEPGVIELQAPVFQEFTALKDVVLPSTVSYINSYAFNGCKNLESINIPNGVKLLEYALLAGCDKLKTLVIPQSVSKISSLILYSYEREEPITIVLTNDVPPTINSDSFSGVPTGSKFIVPCGSLSAYSAAEGWSNIKNWYTIEEDFVYNVNVVANDNNGGSVTVLQEPDCERTAIVEAIPSEGYKFVGWSDGYKEAHYEFEVHEDVSLTAIFKSISVPVNTIRADKMSNDVVKTIVDGRIVIIKDNKMYGIVGELIGDVK